MMKQWKDELLLDSPADDDDSAINGDQSKSTISPAEGDASRDSSAGSGQKVKSPIQQ